MTANKRVLDRKGSADSQIKCDSTTPLAAISLNVSEENKEPSILLQDGCTNDYDLNKNTELDKYKDLEYRYNILLDQPTARRKVTARKKSRKRCYSLLHRISQQTSF